MQTIKIPILCTSNNAIFEMCLKTNKVYILCKQHSRVSENNVMSLHCNLLNMDYGDNIIVLVSLNESLETLKYVWGGT